MRIQSTLFMLETIELSRVRGAVNSSGHYTRPILGKVKWPQQWKDEVGTAGPECGAGSPGILE